MQHVVKMQTWKLNKTGMMTTGRSVRNIIHCFTKAEANEDFHREIEVCIVVPVPGKGNAYMRPDQLVSLVHELNDLLDERPDHEDMEASMTPRKVVG
jgi:hypothetical protein